MFYHDFYLTIDHSRGDYYPITAKWDGAHAQDELRLNSEHLTHVWENLEMGGANRNFTKVVGGALYDSLFHGAVGKLYHECLGQVRGKPHEGICLRLTVRPSDLADIPWEILHDGSHFLATSTKTPLSRYIELDAPIYELKTDSIKVLIVIPEGSGLNTDGEKTQVVNALRKVGSRVQIEVLDKEVTRKKIRNTLNLERQYQIFHFIGHTTQDDAFRDCLVLNSEVEGKRDLITADEFSLFFMEYEYLKLVVLNSCEGARLPSSEPSSGMAPLLINEQIPAVIAMQYDIEDEVATLFAEEFYTRLTEGDNKGRVDACVSYARRVLCQDYHKSEFIIPVLFSRSQVIFDLERKSKKIGSVEEVHLAESVLQIQENNIEILSGQAKNPPAENAERINERLAREIEDAEQTRNKIKKWRQRVAIQSGAVFLFVLAACWVGFFGLLNLDDYIERRFISFMGPHVEEPFSEKVRLIAVKEGDNGTFGTLIPGNLESSIPWRNHFAKLITDLAQAEPKPRVIALDTLISASKNPSEAEVRANTALITAVNDAVDKQKVPVIAATELGAKETPLLKDSRASLGDVNNLRPHNITNLVRESKLAKFENEISSSDCTKGEVPVFPSFPLLALMQFGNMPGDPSCPDSGGTPGPWTPPVVACLDETEDRINLRDSSKTLVREIPVFTEYSKSGVTPMMSKIALAEPIRLKHITETIEEAYSDSKMLKNPVSYQGGIVIIGVFGESDIGRVTDSEGEPRNGKRYGAEIQANVLSNLLTCSYIYTLPIVWDLIIILLMVALGILLQKLAGTRSGWVLPIKIPKTELIIELSWLLLIVPIVYFLIAFVAYKEWRLLLPANATYHLLALVIAYYMTGFARTKAGLR
jgi:CHASE2 domain-containing sensor protein